MIALVDERIDSSSLLTLKKMGAELFLMPAANYLQKGVASHPDMLLFIGFGKLFDFIRITLFIAKKHK